MASGNYKTNTPKLCNRNKITKILATLLRMLTKTKLKDMVSTKSLLNQTNMMSVNQINAQIKIQEIWKALNIQDYPIKIEKQTVKDVGTVTRACTCGRFVIGEKSCISQKTCLNDAIRIWNQLPTNVTQCLSFNQVKIQSKLCAKQKSCDVYPHYLKLQNHLVT